MKKKIAVIVRERQAEALRMGIGLTILNDEVNIFVLDRRLADTEEVRFNLDMIRELHLKLYTKSDGNGQGEVIPVEEIAERLLQYDHVLPY